MGDDAQRTRVTCSCGHTVEIRADDASCRRTCPECGLELGDDGEHPDSPDSESTQMVNLEEMARMAQNGVDVGVSGEWNTETPKSPDGED